VSPPRFGVGLRADRSPADCARLGRLAEDLGFEVVSVFGDLGDQPPLPALLAIAESTHRVMLGPACVNPYTTHPVEIAGHIAALDIVSAGRAYLGLAKGAWLDTIQMRQPRPVQSIRETACLVAMLLAGDLRGYRGEIFTLQPGFGLGYPRMRSRVPLLIGGWGPKTVALAGEIADELKVGGSANPEIVPIMRSRLAVGAARVGRLADATDIVLGAVTVVDTDGPAARVRARTAVARYFEVVAGLDPTIELPGGLMDTIRSRLAAGDAIGAGAAIGDELLDRFAFAGTPAHVSRRVGEIFARGASRVEFGAPFGLAADAGLRLLAERVVSEFR
jgi:5,10-methylenetetrahydromethanopterin reductase